MLVHADRAAGHEVHLLGRFPFVIDRAALNKVRPLEESVHVSDALVIKALKERKLRLGPAPNLCQQRLAKRGGQLAHDLLLLVKVARLAPRRAVEALDMPLQVGRALPEEEVLGGVLQLLGDPVVSPGGRVYEGRDGSHAVGEDDGADQGRDDAEDALAVRGRHDVPVPDSGDGNRGPVHGGHVPRPVVGGAQVGPVGVHPVDVGLGHEEEVEEAAEGVRGEDDEEEGPRDADGALEPAEAVLVAQLAEEVEHLDGADQLEEAHHLEEAHCPDVARRGEEQADDRVEGEAAAQVGDEPCSGV